MSSFPQPTQEIGNESLTSARFPILLFFDGECAFCNRWVNRVKEADPTHHIRFGTKQGRTYESVAARYPELEGTDSVVVISRQANGQEVVFVRSAAIREIIQDLPKFWFFAFVLQICPQFLADIGYRIFSKLRAPLFGRWSHCRIPLEEEKMLYVD